MVKFLQTLLLPLSFILSTNTIAELPSISIELNRLMQKDKNCVTYFMIKNNSDFNFSEFKTEMVTFDKDGLITNRILGDFQKIRPKKTVVKLFAIPDTKCSSIDKILINDVHSCKANTEKNMDCLDWLQPSYRAKIELFK